MHKIKNVDATNEYSCDLCSNEDKNLCFRYVYDQHPELDMMLLCGECGLEMENDFWRCIDY